jgi:hypothetical protein
MKATLLELIEIFLLNRQRGLKEEDILSGRPWENEEEGRHYFQLQPLMRFLKREGAQDIPQSRVVTFIRTDLEGGYVFKHIKGHGRNLFWIHNSRLQAVPMIDPPKLLESPI